MFINLLNFYYLSFSFINSFISVFIYSLSDWLNWSFEHSYFWRNKFNYGTHLCTSDYRDQTLFDTPRLVARWNARRAQTEMKEVLEVVI